MTMASRSAWELFPELIRTRKQVSETRGTISMQTTYIAWYDTSLSSLSKHGKCQGRKDTSREQAVEESNIKGFLFHALFARRYL
jgi:hypothetical protein